MSNTPWVTDKWFTSPWNFAPEAMTGFDFAKKVKFHDVTLRDGEQQAGLVFNKDQKVALAEKMAEMKSEAGRLIHTPLMPQRRGKMRMKGTRNSSWRLSERKMDLPGWAMLWKKLPVTIWKPTMGNIKQL